MLHPFPLIRGGGLFLICVGLGFLLGGIFPKFRLQLAFSGFIVGFIASALNTVLLPAPKLGGPSIFQIIVLVAALVIEGGLIYFVISRYGKAGDRPLLLAILIAVGLHFLIMTFSHGALMFLLGVLVIANAVIAILIPRINVIITAVIDSLLKIGVGLWMVLYYPPWGISN